MLTALRFTVVSIHDEIKKETGVATYLLMLITSDPGECDIVEQEFEYGGRVQPKDTLK